MLILTPQLLLLPIRNAFVALGILASQDRLVKHAPPVITLKPPLTIFARPALPIHTMDFMQVILWTRVWRAPTTPPPQQPAPPSSPAPAMLVTDTKKSETPITPAMNALRARIRQVITNQPAPCAQLDPSVWLREPLLPQPVTLVRTDTSRFLMGVLPVPPVLQGSSRI